MDGTVTKTTRQLKITTPKVIPLVTELSEKKKAIITNQDGNMIELAPHQLTRGLKTFLQSSNITIEYTETESRRGKVELAGINVKVLPVNHTNYDGGAFVRILESGPMSYDNTNKVLDYLTKHGINVSKECVFVDEHTEEGACLFKTGAKK